MKPYHCFDLGGKFWYDSASQRGMYALSLLPFQIHASSVNTGAYFSALNINLNPIQVVNYIQEVTPWVK